MSDIKLVMKSTDHMVGVGKNKNTNLGTDSSMELLHYYDDPRYAEQLKKLLDEGAEEGMDVMHNGDDGSVVRVHYVPSYSKHIWNPVKGKFEVPKVVRKNKQQNVMDVTTKSDLEDDVIMSSNRKSSNTHDTGSHHNVELYRELIDEEAN